MNTLEPPRWPGGPPICPAANLPAFPDEAASLRFHETHSPGSRTAGKLAVVREHFEITFILCLSGYNANLYIHQSKKAHFFVARFLGKVYTF